MTLETALQVLPVGFNRGRRSNTIAVLETDSVAWAEITSTVEQWGLDEGLSDWQLRSASGFLTGTAQAGFDLVWRFWKRGESADDVVRSLLDHDAV